VKHIESKNTCGVARRENSLVPGILVCFFICKKTTKKKQCLFKLSLFLWHIFTFID